VTTKAFVLVETEGGKIKEVFDTLNRLKGIKSVDAVTGPYDIIVIIEGEGLNDLGDLITDRINTIAGISRTVTCLAI
jgi:DNA-binding Lrp family transcriptional regulator